MSVSIIAAATGPSLQTGEATVAARRRPRRSLPIAVESLILAVICLMDLVTTIHWVQNIDASEGNPLMAYYLESGGVLAFIAAKFVLCFAPLAIAEWARRTRPRFVHAALRFGIAGYVGLYILGVAHINHDQPVQEATAVTYSAPSAEVISAHAAARAVKAAAPTALASGQ